MNKEKGQIQIIAFLFIIVVAAVLFFVFFGSKEEEKTLEATPSSQPVFQEEAIISSPPEEEKEVPVSPSPVADAYAPYRFNGQPVGGSLPSYTRKAFISLETSEKAVCRYSDISGMSYYSMNRVFTNTDSFFHSTQVTGLSEGKGYIYYIRCADDHGNANTADFYIYFAVKDPDDFTPPVRRHQYPTGDVLPSGTIQTIIGISTDEPASCRYSFSQGTSYNSMRKSLTKDETEQYHTAKITNLSNGSSYSFFVRCKDLEDNVNTGDVMISFSIRQ